MITPEAESALRPGATATRLAWHPIDLGGLRLYRVDVTWPVEWKQRDPKSSYIVAGRSPMDAAARFQSTYRDGVVPVAHGSALHVLQPASWWNDGIPEIK